MGSQLHGKFKADKLEASIIRTIDAKRDAEERREDVEGARSVLFFRSRFFDDGLTRSGKNKRVFIPNKEG